MELTGIYNVLGILGAYFAIVLVLSIAVEAIIDSIKANKWLNAKAQTDQFLRFADIQKHRISPDQAMRDIAYWIPPKSQAEVQVAALNNLAQSFDFALDEVAAIGEISSEMTRDLIAMTGLNRQSAQLRASLAQKLYAIRVQYDSEEAQRIARMKRMAAVIGTIVAVLLQIDTFSMLSPLLSPAMAAWVDNIYMATAGMFLTGIAASAGSAFWHDQLDRIRAVKNSARTINALVERPAH